MIRCGINACNGFIERPAPDNTVVNMTLVTCERPRSNSKGSVKSNQPIDARGCGREAPYEDEFLASWIYPRLGGSDCRPLLMAHVMIGLGPDAPELAGVLAGALVEIIELKWLLAGEGFHVHVERLQTDREYAREALHRAQASTNAALRAKATRLLAKLQLAES